MADGFRCSRGREEPGRSRSVGGAEVSTGRGGAMGPDTRVGTRSPGQTRDVERAPRVWRSPQVSAGLHGLQWAHATSLSCQSLVVEV